MDKKLEKIIREAFSLNSDEIDPGWTSDDIPKWDSMGHLNLIMAVEKEFNIKFEIEEMFMIQKLADIVTFIEKRT